MLIQGIINACTNPSWSIHKSVACNAHHRPHTVSSSRTHRRSLCAHACRMVCPATRTAATTSKPTQKASNRPSSGRSRYHGRHVSRHVHRQDIEHVDYHVRTLSCMRAFMYHAGMHLHVRVGACISACLFVPLHVQVLICMSSQVSNWLLHQQASISDGCSGGSAAVVWNLMALGKGTVSRWADLYTGKSHFSGDKCGSVCPCQGTHACASVRVSAHL